MTEQVEQLKSTISIKKELMSLPDLNPATKELLQDGEFDPRVLRTLFNHYQNQKPFSEGIRQLITAEEEKFRPQAMNLLTLPELESFMEEVIVSGELSESQLLFLTAANLKELIAGNIYVAPRSKQLLWAADTTLSASEVSRKRPTYCLLGRRHTGKDRAEYVKLCSPDRAGDSKENIPSHPDFLACSVCGLALCKHCGSVGLPL